MLSDDITGGIGKVFGAIGRVIGSGIRGAVLFGVLAFAAGALITAVPLIAGATMAGGAIFGAAMATGLTCAAYGAIGGAALLAVTSLIPGTSEGLGFKKLLARREPVRASEPEIVMSPAPQYVVAPPAPAVQYVPVPVPVAAPAQPTQDNPLYKPGRGTELMQKGDNAPSTNVCR